MVRRSAAAWRGGAWHGGLWHGGAGCGVAWRVVAWRRGVAWHGGVWRYTLHVHGLAHGVAGAADEEAHLQLEVEQPAGRVPKNNNYKVSKSCHISRRPLRVVVTVIINH